MNHLGYVAEQIVQGDPRVRDARRRDERRRAARAPRRVRLLERARALTGRRLPPVPGPVAAGTRPAPASRLASPAT